MSYVYSSVQWNCSWLQEVRTVHAALLSANQKLGEFSSSTKCHSHGDTEEVDSLQPCQFCLEPHLDLSKNSLGNKSRIGHPDSQRQETDEMQKAMHLCSAMCYGRAPLHQKLNLGVQLLPGFVYIKGWCRGNRIKQWALISLSTEQTPLYVTLPSQHTNSRE